jgi:hypothetical protein
MEGNLRRKTANDGRSVPDLDLATAQDADFAGL